MSEFNDENDPIYREIVKARVKMYFDFPFFGTLATRLVTEDATDTIETMATDGRRLMYNRDFVKSLKLSQLLFVVAHEVLHGVYDHISRRKDRDPAIWGMAIDYVTNYTLVEMKIGEMPSGGLYDREFTDEMTAEEIYNILISRGVKPLPTLDHHLDTTPYGAEEEAQMRNEMRAALIQAAQANPGSTPLGIKRLIGEICQPKMDWRELLDSHIRSAVKGDFSFSRISRRAWGSGLVLPAQELQDRVEVCVSVDTSGSMSEGMLRDILGEVKGIMDTFRDFELKLWTFDGSIHGYKEFRPDNLDEILDYPMLGGGGTDFMVNWEFMKEKGIEPHRLVMFTDGYPCGSWGDPNYCDTLFVIHGDRSRVSPFGMTCYYEDSKN